MTIKKRLAMILESIKAENVSMSEVVFLQAHQADIKKLYPDEPELWQWADIPESEYMNQ